MNEISELMLEELEVATSARDSFPPETMSTGCPCSNMCAISCSSTCENSCEGSCYTMSR